MDRVLNISNCFKALEILNRRIDSIESKFIGFDSAFSVGPDGKPYVSDISKSKKSSIGWICYELDNSNYPRSMDTYISYSRLGVSCALLGLPVYVLSSIDLSSSGSEAISILSTYLLEELPKSESIKLIAKYNKYLNLS